MTVFTTEKPAPALRAKYDHAFDLFAARVATSAATVPKGAQLYRTNVDGLFEKYLGHFADPVEKQFLNCSCCRSFFNRYAGLVAIKAGVVTSLAFNFDGSDLPAPYDRITEALRAAVVGGRVISTFYSRDKVLGQPQTGVWDHLAVPNPTIYSNRVQTPGQKAAADRVQFVAFKTGLMAFPQSVFDTAVALLTTAQLTQDSFLRVAHGLSKARQYLDIANAETNEVQALLWEALGTGTVGSGSVRSSALGSLLSDLNSGMAHDHALARFKTIVDPMAYKRATTAPKLGNIQRAEKIVADLNLAPSFARRLATLAEVLPRASWLWLGDKQPAAEQAAPAPAPAGGVFDALKPKAADPVVVGARPPMTWEQFVKRVLPTADAIELLPHGDNTYGAITAPSEVASAPLFNWDTEDARNPYSWYRWNATDPASFGLAKPTLVRAVVPVPSTWNGGKNYPGVVLVAQDAVDQRLDVAGLGLFPDLLRRDLHEIRSTIFAHSCKGSLAVPTGATASGLVLRQGACNAVLRVSTGTVAVTYVINGWE